MTISSYFLPDNALQGEEIPTYIIWKDIEYDEIKITIFNCCEVKEYYNVDINNVKVMDGHIIIKTVEVDGYLGILFKTERTSDLLIKAEIKYDFIKDGNVIDSVISNIVLFKPEIEIKKIPDEVLIENGSVREEDKILLENVGEGTCRIKFNSTDNSQIEITQPKRIREFVNGFYETFDNEIEKIKNKYENYEYVFNDIAYIFENQFDPGDEENLKEFKTRIERIEDAFEVNEKLRKDIIRIYIHSLLKNINVITIMEQFLDYLRSIEKNRVILLNALDSIELSEGDNMIELEINYTDLLNTKINPIKIRPIIIKSDKDIDISIYNLFNWLGETDNDI